MNYQDLSYVPEVIRTELISRHHDEGTSALTELKNSLPGNTAVALNNGRTPVTIQSLSLTGLRTYYATSQCR